MNTETIVMSILIVAVVFYLIKNINRDITIKLTIDDGYPLKDDGVVELEVPEPIVKVKRAYNKRPKTPITKINTVAKKPIGRPKKSK